VDNEKKIEFVSQSYRNTQDMISLADAKANISFSIQALLVGIVLGASFLANTFENAQNLDSTISYVFYIIIVGFVILSFVGIILSIAVYKARPPLETIEQKRKGLLYFGHITQFPTFDDYFSEVNSIDEDRVLREFARQAYHLSYIAEKKMKYVNISIYLLIFNLCLIIILIILSGYINMLQTLGGIMWSLSMT
jgi:hypothetical protein